MTFSWPRSQVWHCSTKILMTGIASNIISENHNFYGCGTDLWHIQFNCFSIVLVLMARTWWYWLPKSGHNGQQSPKHARFWFSNISCQGNWKIIPESFNRIFGECSNKVPNDMSYENILGCLLWFADSYDNILSMNSSLSILGTLRLFHF